MIVEFVFLLVLGLASATPLRSVEDGANRVLYDQRQEGEWNVNANLENFVILIIPTQSQQLPGESGGSPAPAATPSLLDLLSRAIPRRPLKGLKHHHPKKHRPLVAAAANEERTNQHFVESKSAPYHVDISSAKGQLAKLHPESAVISAEEIVLDAKSPALKMFEENNGQRTTRAFLLTAEPATDELAEKKSEKKSEEMMLLGAENEQCGPGLARDSQGICRIIKSTT